MYDVALCPFGGYNHSSCWVGSYTLLVLPVLNFWKVMVCRLVGMSGVVCHESGIIVKVCSGQVRPRGRLS